MANTIDIEELSNALTKEIRQYTNEIEETTLKVIKDTSKEIVERVKENSPVRTGEYRKGWKMKKKGNSYLIYNKERPQLVHLLEFGHITRNGKRVEGKLNLIKQYNKAIEELPKKIKEGVKRIGR